MEAMLNRVPNATYRLQFHAGFRFDQAREILGYLHELGISDVYASPLFQAGPESTHGYDVCRHEKIHPNLGSEGDFQKFTAALKENGLGLLLDIVPNHMGTHSSNTWWTDVLKHGPKSKYGQFFDINWEPENPTLRGKVLLPVLGKRYAECLADGELQLKNEKGELVVSYYGKIFPLSPESLTWAAAELGLPKDALLNPGKDHSGASASFLEKANAIKQDGGEFLHQLLERQHYRLAFWRKGSEEINYRRFFDITELVSLRVEDAEVFRASHHFLFSLIRKGIVTGVRIDHPDGLRDPKLYLEQLQEEFTKIAPGKNLYVVVEKILSPDEPLPADWLTAGTTGYDYLNQLNGLFVKSDNEKLFSRFYAEFTGFDEPFDQLVVRSKLQILEQSLISETKSLFRRLQEIARRTRYARDFTPAELEHGLKSFLAAFPVYRTYATKETTELSDFERSFVLGTLAKLAGPVSESKHAAKAPASVYHFVADLLLLRSYPDFPAEVQEQAREFVIRFQQLSGPATAKGIEDTAFYRYFRLSALNEVGGTPEAFGTSAEDFHSYNKNQARSWPHAILATSTHDTKRGEDLRARLCVVSEIPEPWTELIEEVSEKSEQLKTKLPGDLLAPSANDEYLIYQTVAGSWSPGEPQEEYIERLQQYLTKASREAKVHTSWLDPNSEYEEALTGFARRFVESEIFRERFAPFVNRLALFGYFNSAAQVLIKAASPGVPDFYQGCELWNFSLVDPDNRRPVDYSFRQKMLERMIRELKEGSRLEFLEKLQQEPSNPMLKLFTTWSILRFRAEHPELFSKGAYVPLQAQGPQNRHVIAFARTHQDQTVIVATARWLAALTGFGERPLSSIPWGETTLEIPAGGCQDFFSGRTFEGERISCQELFRHFPVALLTSS